MVSAMDDMNVGRDGRELQRTVTPLWPVVCECIAWLELIAVIAFASYAGGVRL